MITIHLHPNGFEITGHASSDICSEVSILSWACINTVSSLDPNSEAQVSDRGRHNPGEGLSRLVFDITNDYAKWVYEEFVINLEKWGKVMWPPSEVVIEHVDEDLKKEEPHEDRDH